MEESRGKVLITFIMLNHYSNSTSCSRPCIRSNSYSSSTWSLNVILIAHIYDNGHADLSRGKVLNHYSNSTSCSQQHICSNSCSSNTWSLIACSHLWSCSLSCPGVQSTKKDTNDQICSKQTEGRIFIVVIKKFISIEHLYSTIKEKCLAKAIKEELTLDQEMEPTLPQNLLFGTVCGWANIFFYYYYLNYYVEQSATFCDALLSLTNISKTSQKHN